MAGGAGNSLALARIAQRDADKHRSAEGLPVECVRKNRKRKA
jgi:hypothetical protein